MIRSHAAVHPAMAFTAACLGCIVSGTSCTCTGSQAGAGHCTTRCVEEALVDIIERAEPTGKSTCLGTVVARSSTRTFVLTAAHCGFRAGQDVALDVRTADGARSVVRERWVHPRYSAAALASAYDLAVLAIERPAETTLLPAVLGSRSVGEGLDLQVLSRTRLDTTTELRWTAITALRESNLSLAVDGLGAELCRGTSGAPVVVANGTELSIAGVLSRGSADCSGPGTVARAWPILEVLRLAQTRQRLEPSLSKRPCGECAAVLSEMHDECVSAVSGCRGEKDCAAFLRCLESCAEPSCAETCGRSGKRSERTAALCRCLAARGCREECSSPCSDVEKMQ